MQEPGDALDSLQLGITKRYGNKVVLDNLQLDIRKGEFVTFLGPQRLRQVDGAVDRRRAYSGDRGRDPAQRRACRSSAAGEKRAFGMVFPELCAVSPHDGVRQCGLRAYAEAAG